MKALQLTISFAEGGRRRVMTTLMEQLRTLGVECDLACVQELGCPKEEAARVAGAVEVLGQRSVFDGRAVKRLRDFCRRRQIDIIHAHDAAAQFVAARMRLRGPRVPLIMTFHRSLGIESARWRDRLRNRLAYVLTGAVVAVSEERRRHYLEQNHVAPSKVLCIPNGIDVDRFRCDPAVRTATRQELGVADDAVVLGAVGHFGAEKGLDIVLRGFRELQLLVPATDLRLVIAGDGAAEDRRTLERLAGECQGRVVFLGRRTDLPRWFRAFDVFLHAPRQEAFGLVVIEAMAAGAPVVATRVGGVPEIVRDGETGRLVEAESPRALASATLDLVQSATLRREWGRRGHGVVRSQFTVALQARRYLRLYEDLRAGRAPCADAIDVPLSDSLSPDRAELQSTTT